VYAAFTFHLVSNDNVVVVEVGYLFQRVFLRYAPAVSQTRVRITKLGKDHARLKLVLCRSHEQRVHLLLEL